MCVRKRRKGTPTHVHEMKEICEVMGDNGHQTPPGGSTGLPSPSHPRRGGPLGVVKGRSMSVGRAELALLCQASVVAMGLGACPGATDNHHPHIQWEVGIHLHYLSAYRDFQHQVVLGVPVPGNGQPHSAPSHLCRWLSSPTERDLSTMW